MIASIREEIRVAQEAAHKAQEVVGNLKRKLVEARASQGDPVSEAHAEIAEQIRERLPMFKSEVCRKVLAAVADAFDGTDRMALINLDDEMSR